MALEPMGFTDQQITESREKALEQIKEFLKAEDVDAQFADRSGDYHSKEKFIVSWNGNWNGIPAEFSVDKVDAFFAQMSGSKAIYATQGLFHQKQLGAYSSIERALIEVGLKLCKTNVDKKEFYNAYAVKYNNRIRNNQSSKNEQSC